MTFDLQQILESKRAYRRDLARLPIAVKLAMLEDLRERALAIRKAGESLKAKKQFKSEPRQ